MRIQARVGYSTKPRVGRVEKTENLWSVVAAGLCLTLVRRRGGGAGPVALSSDGQTRLLGAAAGLVGSKGRKHLM